MIHLKEGFFEEQLQARYKITPDQLMQAQKQNQQNKNGVLANLQQMGVLTEKQMIEIQVELFGTNMLQLKNHLQQRDADNGHDQRNGEQRDPRSQGHDFLLFLGRFPQVISSLDAQCGQQMTNAFHVAGRADGDLLDCTVRHSQ